MEPLRADVRGLLARAGDLVLVLLEVRNSERESLLAAFELREGAQLLTPKGEDQMRSGLCSQ